MSFINLMLALLELLEETKQELNVAFDLVCIDNFKGLKVTVRCVVLEPVMEETQDFTSGTQAVS